MNNFDKLFDVNKETQRLCALINVNCQTLKCFPSDTTSGYHIAPFFFQIELTIFMLDVNC